MEKKKKAQVLLITLIVLMVIAVLVLTVLTVLLRDSDQVFNTAEYQKALNVSEELVRESVTYLGEEASLTAGLSSNLDSFIEEYFESCSVSGQTHSTLSYECIGEEYLEENMVTSLVIQDVKNIENYPINNDEGLRLSLENYNLNASLEVSWDTTAAMEFLISYRNSDGLLKSVDEVWEPTQDILSSAPTHIVTFSNLSDDGVRRVRLSGFNNISNISSLHSIVITPRIRTTGIVESNISIQPSDYTTYPYQLREFRVTAFNSNNPNAPVVTTQAQVPLFPQLDAIFNYTLLTNGNIQID